MKANEDGLERRRFLIYNLNIVNCKNNNFIITFFFIDFVQMHFYYKREKSKNRINQNSEI